MAFKNNTKNNKRTKSKNIEAKEGSAIINVSKVYLFVVWKLSTKKIKFLVITFNSKKVPSPCENGLRIFQNRQRKRFRLISNDLSRYPYMKFGTA